MDIITYANFQENLKSFLDQVCLSHTPLAVTRAKGEDVIVLSKEDYERMKETCYLLSSPKNAERIHRAVEDLDQGRGVKQALME